MELGLVKDIGVMRKTGSSHAAIVWVVIPTNERPAIAATSDQSQPNPSAADVLDFAI